MKDLTSEQRSQWIEWIARNLANGVSQAELASTMATKGFGQKQIETLTTEVISSPVFSVAKAFAWRANNLEGLMDIRNALLGGHPGHLTIERRSKLSSDEFFERYYAQNWPVVITDLVQQWPAFEKWSPDYFRKHYGEVVVDIQANRQTDPVYEVFLKGHTEKVTLGDFSQMVLEGGETNSFYLTANDRLLEHPSMRSLLEDFWPFEGLFRSDDRHGKQFLWFGPKGAVSPLHRDRLNVFMTQVFGRKRVKMISSQALHRVYNFESFFSQVDAENPDLKRFPKFAGVEVIDVELEPGDALLIPVGWWHHVRSLDVSINISLTNFARSNDFERFYPN
ncbi:hypothetical protein B5K05_33245 [Rhizobium phaseoli]|uniref:cupin-like domain-containing protein n=1 Tax=Rhizobium phaseoli TaxID=396 RepID=UPI000E0CDEB0|nr:cupin-like domain-containing protein [Rhizobium phaseoli]RDJ00739.1 hypothetical protein B5K05_33245 [Rhizobium phaseoli]RDJ00939.1 hypothetical protein B5K04_31330 [Rhizobium phaseoli]